jgi:putative endonuclease
MLASLLRKILGPKSTLDDTLGQKGENVAAKFLTTKGYKIIQRNFNAKVGEIDIVARKDKTIVFVEVKTRVEDQVRPEDQVTLEKQHQISKAADVFLSRFGFPQPPAQFDVIAILWPPGREPIIRHHENAFQTTI